MLALSAAGLVAMSGCGGSAPAARLTGSVGPGFIIVLDDSAGKPVRTLSAGRYTITVHDRSAFLNFHLFGPGVNEATSILGTGTRRWSVALKPGVYQFQCDAHAALVHGSFEVTG